ncbi:MAG: VWA domain-containing protein [Thermoanaerobaculia bacterium]|jgi:Ca-activated chloride channel family protein
MRITIATVILALSLPALAEPAPPTPSPIKLTHETLGDSDAGVVTRMTASFEGIEAPPGVPLELQGSITQTGIVTRTFRYQLRADARSFSFVQTVPTGTVAVDVRLIVPIENEMPMILGKASASIEIAKTGREYVAAENAGAEEIVAEGLVPETAGAVKIRPPRRDLAPNLFIVDVDVKPPVKKVEFWIGEKKIFTKNAPPYHAELDLGSLPRRVEVRVLGFDPKGRFVDADAWVVNERDNPVEAKISRNATPDGVTHIKVSVQNGANSAIAKVTLDAGGRRLTEWTHAPYAISIPTKSLDGAEFITALVLDAEGRELASDLMFLNGQRFGEEIQVNLIELPVTVVDKGGAVVAGLVQDDFTVFEQGKSQKIATFNFASNLPLSIGVLVDHSGSMKPRIEVARQAAIEFFKDILSPGDRAFFGGFSWEAQRVSPFLTDVASLTTQIEAMPEPDGGTALYDAIVTGLYRFRAIPGRKALIVVTDGEDTVSRLKYDQMLQYVRTARVPVYFIAIGVPSIGSSSIKNLAAETGAVVYFVKNVEGLSATYDKLERDLRSQYLVGYYAESTKNDSAYRSVEVKVKKEGAIVRSIRGYIP